MRTHIEFDDFGAYEELLEDGGDFAVMAVVETGSDRGRKVA